MEKTGLKFKLPTMHGEPGTEAPRYSYSITISAVVIVIVLSSVISNINTSHSWCQTWNTCLYLTHWVRVTHICISRLTSIGSDNGLSPGWRQAIIWTNAVILLIGPIETNFSEILIIIQTFSFKKILLEMSSVKCRPFCLGLNVLMVVSQSERRISTEHGMIHLTIWKQRQHKGSSCELNLPDQ